ncbi:MAG: ABC transporter ATP-binding protein, partial [Solirubrobacteraceae bacterium]
MSPPGGGGGGGAGRGARAFGPGHGRGVSQWDGQRASAGSRGRNLRGLLQLLAPYRLRVAAMLTALIIGTAAGLAPPLLAKFAIDKGIDKHATATLAIVVVAFLASATVLWAMTYVQTFLVGWVGQRALADLRIRIFTHLQSQPVGFYESRSAGVLISRMTNDVEALENLVTDSVVTLFQSGLTLIGAIAMLLYLDWKLALLTFCVIPFVAGGSIWFRLVSATAFRRTRETIGSITAYLQESLSGIRVVRSFGQESRHERIFATLNAGNVDANMTTVRLNAAYFPAVEMLSGVALAVIVLYGGYQTISGHITAGTVVAFVATMSYLFEPIQQLSQLYTTYQSGMAALEKIFQLLDVEPELSDAPDAIELPPIRGEVTFEAVTFAYGARRRSGRQRADGAGRAGGPWRADGPRRADGAGRAGGP